MKSNCSPKTSNYPNTHKSSDSVLKMKISKTKYTPNYNILDFQPLWENFWPLDFLLSFSPKTWNDPNTHKSFDSDLKIKISKTKYTVNYNTLNFEPLWQHFWSGGLKIISGLKKKKIEVKKLGVKIYWMIWGKTCCGKRHIPRNNLYLFLR